MSSISTQLPASSAAQQNDSDKIQSDSDDFIKATASGDKKGISASRKALDDDFKQAQKDGYSKSALQNDFGRIREEGLSTTLAGQFKKGTLKPGDKHSSQMVQARYQAFLKDNNFKASDDAWGKFSSEMGASLKAAGVSDGDVNTTLSAAKTTKLPAFLTVLPDSRV